MLPTLKQMQAIKKLKVKTLQYPEMKLTEYYLMPCCEKQRQDTPIIENAGDNTTLIQCPFGCGFIYIESWL